MKKLFVLALFLGAVLAVMPAYCQEEPVKEAPVLLAPVSGEVVSVDVENAALTVKQLQDAVAGTYEEVSVQAAPETVISKGENALKITDLKAGDKVVVEYTVDEQGNSRVATITVQ